MYAWRCALLYGFLWGIRAVAAIFLERSGMYDSNDNENSVRLFVGPFTAGDPAMMNVWFMTHDLGMPRLIPAGCLAGGMLFERLLKWFRRAPRKAAAPIPVASPVVVAQPRPSREEKRTVEAA